MGLVAVVALLLAANASAAGPQTSPTQGGLGVVARDGRTRYVVVSDGSVSVAEAVKTHGGAISSNYSVEGNWGIPTVTILGEPGGLSRDGQVLVLADATPPSPSRTQSTFLLMSTHPLATENVVKLRGDFSYDALSPDARTLYLIQRVSVGGSDYRVRAYDLQRAHLLPSAIADKRQEGWTMTGYPVARASSADGRWVYTLYRNDGGYPFVHALDSVDRSAVCIGLPWPERTNQDALSRSSLRLEGHELTVAVAKGPRFVVDTRTYAVTKPSRHGAEEVLPGAAAAAMLFFALTGFALRRRRRTDR